jgi:CopG family nickel-responsive transcriptional regulator
MLYWLLGGVNVMAKRRFGISLPKQLADKLDKLSEIMKVDRSNLVSRAVEIFIEEYEHYIKEHICQGVMVVVQTDTSIRPEISRLLEEYSDIVLLSLHYHVKGRCLEIVLVRGHSRRIAEMHSKLEKLGCKVRYIPLARVQNSREVEEIAKMQ